MHWSESTLKAALKQKRCQKKETFIVNNLMEYLHIESMLAHRLPTFDTCAEETLPQTQ